MVFTIDHICRLAERLGIPCYLGYISSDTQNVWADCFKPVLIARDHSSYHRVGRPQPMVQQHILYKMGGGDLKTMQTGVTPRHFIRTSGRSRRLPPPAKKKPQSGPKPKVYYKMGGGGNPTWKREGGSWLAGTGPSSNVCRKLSLSRSNFTSSALLAYVRCERLAARNLGQSARPCFGKQCDEAALHEGEGSAEVMLKMLSAEAGPRVRMQMFRRFALALQSCLCKSVVR